MSQQDRKSIILSSLFFHCLSSLFRFFYCGMCARENAAIQPPANYDVHRQRSQRKHIRMPRLIARILTITCSWNVIYVKFSGVIVLCCCLTNLH